MPRQQPPVAKKSFPSILPELDYDRCFPISLCTSLQIILIVIYCANLSRYHRRNSRMVWDHSKDAVCRRATHPFGPHTPPFFPHQSDILDLPFSFPQRGFVVPAAAHLLLVPPFLLYIKILFHILHDATTRELFVHLSYRGHGLLGGSTALLRIFISLEHGHASMPGSGSGRAKGLRFYSTRAEHLGKGHFQSGSDWELTG